jgi:molybdate transport system substrate-binding protein
MMMRRFWYSLVIAALALAAGIALGACASSQSDAMSSQQQEVVVYAASSLTDALNEAGAAFEAEHPGARVTFNYASSSTLRTQLEQGAIAGVFASANEEQMDGAVQAGLVSGAPAPFVTNRLAVAVPADGAVVQRLEDMADPGIKVVLALPQVPVGAYSRESLAKMAASPAFGEDFDERVLANVVSEEANVREVLAKVALGEADAGIVYTTDIAAAGGQVSAIAIPDDFNVIAVYPIAVLEEAQAPELAREFVDFLLSEEGQAIMERHGFGPPPGQG